MGKESFTDLAPEAHAIRQQKLEKVITERKQILGRLQQGEITAPIDEEFPTQEDALQAIDEGAVTISLIAKMDAKLAEKKNKIPRVTQKVEDNIMMLEQRQEELSTVIYNRAAFLLNVREGIVDISKSINLKESYKKYESDYEKDGLFKSAVEDIRKLKSLEDEENEVQTESEDFNLPNIITPNTLQAQIFIELSRHLEEGISAELLTQQIYPGEDPEGARSRIFSQIHAIRKKLEGNTLIIESRRDDEGSTKYLLRERLDNGMADGEADEEKDDGIYRYVSRDGKKFKGLSARLMAILSENQKPLSSEQLVEQLYPNIEVDRACTNLRSLISFIRREKLQNSDSEIVYISGEDSETGESGYILINVSSESNSKKKAE